MAKKVVDFLKSLIIKAGGNPEDEAIKAALGKLGSELEVEDEVATAIDNGLLSIATAKNNHPELKKHYFGQAYSGLDAELEAVMQSEKLGEDVINQIKQEPSSTKRAAKLALAIKELEAKKAGANKGDTQKLNEQLAELNNQIRAEKEAKAALEKQHQNDLKNIKKDYALTQELSKYKTIYDQQDPATKNIILTAILNKNLAAKKATLDVDEAGNLILIGEGNTNLFSDDNRVLTPKIFLDQVMANEKMLVVNAEDDTSNQNTHRPNGNTNFNNGRNNGNTNQNGGNHNGNQNGGRKNGVLQELIQQSQRDLEESKGGTRLM